jgi:hypothetical protein
VPPSAQWQGRLTSDASTISRTVGRRAPGARRLLKISAANGAMMPCVTFGAGAIGCRTGRQPSRLCWVATILL